MDEWESARAWVMDRGGHWESMNHPFRPGTAVLVVLRERTGDGVTERSAWGDTLLEAAEKLGWEPPK